jgi:signal transduction histidine kinase/sugar lactone lactonase YvrE
VLVLSLHGLFGCSRESSALESNKSAATDFFSKAWQVEDGLPSSSVGRVVQDHHGYLWLATSEGLARFDGLSFQPFSSPLVATFISRNIRALVAADERTLLMLPGCGGVVRLGDGEFSLQPMSEPLTGKTLDALFVEPGGAIWVGIVNEGVARWQSGELKFFSSAEGLNRGNAKVFFAYSEGRVWIASGNFFGSYRDGQLTSFRQDLGSPLVMTHSQSGLWLWIGDKLQKFEHGQSRAITNFPWKSTASVRDLFEDQTGALWISTAAEGLFRFADGKFSHIQTSHTRINAVSEDHEGNIWVATDGGGVNRLRPKNFQLFTSRSGLREDLSDSVWEDKFGTIWLGNRSGGLGCISNEVAHAVVLQGPSQPNINCVAAATDGLIWFSAAGSLWRFPPGRSNSVRALPSLPRVRALFQDSKDRIWVGGDDGLLGYFSGEQFHFYSNSNGYAGSSARSLAEGPDGSIWIGTEQHELFKLSGERWTQFTERDGLPGTPLRSIHIGRDGLVWIATFRAGLLLYKGNRFIRISVPEGLPSEQITALLEDDTKQLWCCSARGIFYLRKRELLDFADGKISRVNPVSFGKSEGLSGGYALDGFQPVACKSRDGRLWFCTQQGVVAIDPAAMKSNQHPPPVFVQSVLVNDQSRNFSSHGGALLEVPPRSKKIEFRFAALSYAAPEKVRVKYRLEGVDLDWIEAGPQRSAVYAALAPRNYRLRVTACNNDGVWNEQGASLVFTILPAWWQTWWFKTASVLALMSVVGLTVRRLSHQRLKRKLERLEYQQGLERERKRIARDLHDDVGASIAQIGLALEEIREDSTPAEEVKLQSRQLSSRVRTLARDLDAVVWTVNPRNDSLAELVAYLSQYFLELFQNSSIRSRLEVAEEFPDQSLSPEVRHHLFLAAKEAMNNVLKHSKATETTLTLARSNGTFELTLRDNGRGFSSETAARSKRNGLHNIQSRVEEIAGELQIVSEQNKGTVIRIRIPSPKI